MARISVCGNISGLLKGGAYLNAVTGISKPHVFHIKMCPIDGHSMPGIYTKGFWSIPETNDPWTSEPFFLLRKPIQYFDTPACEMRGPTDDTMTQIKDGLKIFERTYPKEVQALGELRECVNEMENANTETDVPFHWDLFPNFQPYYVAPPDKGRLDSVNVCAVAGSDTDTQDANSDVDNSDKDDFENASLYDERHIVTDRLKRRPCAPILVGGSLSTGLSKYRKRSGSISKLNIGDFVCVKVESGDKLPFYVGSVLSVFQYDTLPRCWVPDVADDPDVKFLEIQWWEMKSDCVEKGYSQRLHPAVRLSTDDRCVAHVEVICETSVLYSFESLVAVATKRGKIVSGKLGTRVLKAVMPLVTRKSGMISCFTYCCIYCILVSDSSFVTQPHSKKMRLESACQLLEEDDNKVPSVALLLTYDVIIRVYVYSYWEWLTRYRVLSKSQMT